MIITNNYPEFLLLNAKPVEDKAPNVQCLIVEKHDNMACIVKTWLNEARRRIVFLGLAHLHLFLFCTAGKTWGWRGGIAINMSKFYIPQQMFYPVL